jgi:DnaJ-domain-containing protein 1
MRVVTAIALVLTVSTVRADDLDGGALLNQAAKVQGQILAEFRAVRDKATAQAAGKTLAELDRERERVKQAVAGLNLSAADREAFRRKLDYDRAPVGEILRKEIARVSGIRDAIGVLGDLAVVKEAAVVLEREAKDRAVTVEKALKTYMLKNDGNPPKALRDVARYLNDPKTGLLDPWGREYQLGSSDEGGATIYYTWTVSPYGGGKKRIESRGEKK